MPAASVVAWGLCNAHVEGLSLEPGALSLEYKLKIV